MLFYPFRVFDCVADRNFVFFWLQQLTARNGACSELPGSWPERLYHVRLRRQRSSSPVVCFPKLSALRAVVSEVCPLFSKLFVSAELKSSNSTTSWACACFDTRLLDQFLRLLRNAFSVDKARLKTRWQTLQLLWKNLAIFCSWVYCVSNELTRSFVQILEDFAVELPYAPIQSGCISCQVDVRLLPCNLQWLTLHQC